MGQIIKPSANYMKGKSAEQKKIIKKYFVSKEGIIAKIIAMFTGMKDEGYDALVQSKLKSLNLKQKALSKIGLDESQVSEIKPINFNGYRSTGDFFAKRGKDLKLRTSTYESTWIFFGNQQIYVYINTFSLTEDSKKERTEEYFYKDITSVSTTSDTREFLDDKGKKKTYDESLFALAVSGEKLNVACAASDEVERSVQAMKQKLREKKQ